MASNYTTNYNLNQWSAEDQVRRVDFNADNAKIDAAIKAEADARAAGDAALQTAVDAKASQSALNTLSARVTDMVFGSYTGDGSESRAISLGRTPKAVLLFQQNGGTYFSYNIVQMMGGLVLPGKPITHGGLDAAKIVDGGFWVSYNIPTFSGGEPAAYTNTSGYAYYYIAMF